MDRYLPLYYPHILQSDVGFRNGQFYYCSKLKMYAMDPCVAVQAEAFCYQELDDHVPKHDENFYCYIEEPEKKGFIGRGKKNLTYVPLEVTFENLSVNDRSLNAPACQFSIPLREIYSDITQKRVSPKESIKRFWGYAVKKEREQESLRAESANGIPRQSECERCEHANVIANSSETHKKQKRPDQALYQPCRRRMQRSSQISKAEPPRESVVAKKTTVETSINAPVDLDFCPDPIFAVEDIMTTTLALAINDDESFFPSQEFSQTHQLYSKSGAAIFSNPKWLDEPSSLLYRR